MDSWSAFAMGEANRGNPSMVFDWNAAARRIRETGTTEASAGLTGDWEWTGGEILRDGKPAPSDDTYTFLASTWATPELSLDGDLEDCWIYADKTPGWNADTYWPQSALDILEGKDADVS